MHIARFQATVHQKDRKGVAFVIASAVMPCNGQTAELGVPDHQVRITQLSLRVSSSYSEDFDGFSRPGSSWFNEFLEISVNLILCSNESHDLRL